MSMLQSSFLVQLQKIPTSQMLGSRGVGFLKSVPVPVTALKTAGLTLTGATSPKIAALETSFLGVQWAAGATDAASFNFTVPYDFD